jgi:cysteine desulfurase
MHSIVANLLIWKIPTFRQLAQSGLMNMIMMTYLDYQATTPIAPEVLAAMEPWLFDKFANPHSSHKLGREAAAAVEVARAQVAALLPPGGRVLFTSGATEALNWAIKGSVTRGGGIVVPDSEHAAVRDTALWLGEHGHDVNILHVKSDGLVDLDDAKQKIGANIRLVAAMLVNNEIGVIQPVQQIASLAHARGALFLCDAVQGYGRVAIPDTCDLIAISAHKIHGPIGIGALWVRDGIKLAPLLHGGGQEGGLRSGTLSPALCAGFGAAASLMAKLQDSDSAHVETLWRKVQPLLDQWTLNGDADRRYHGNLNIRRNGLDGARLISDHRAIAFSAGSACASGSGRPSHVLTALGLTKAQASSSIRLGFGRYTSEEELLVAMQMLNASAEHQLTISA